MRKIHRNLPALIARAISNHATSRVCCSRNKACKQAGMRALYLHLLEINMVFKPAHLSARMPGLFASLGRKNRHGARRAWKSKKIARHSPRGNQRCILCPTVRYSVQHSSVPYVLGVAQQSFNQPPAALNANPYCTQIHA